MKPLVFLMTRSFVNGLKRLVTTPRRLFSTLLFLAYYYWLFMRPEMSGRRALARYELLAPAMDVLEGIIFAVFIAISLMLLVSLSSPLTGFRQADVDVLFPTPISPKIVLGFRIARDFLVTLLVPIGFALLGTRPIAESWSFLFRRMPYPEASGIAVRAILFSWAISALTWVCLRYAITLVLAGMDSRGDLFRRVVRLAGGALGVLVLGYLFLVFREAGSPRDLLDASREPIVRTIFLSAWLGTLITMAPLTGNWLLGGLALLGMASLFGASLALALKHCGWLYDHAATKGSGGQELRRFQQTGDVYAVAAAAAGAKGKKMRRTWFHRVNASGPAALVWKDLLLQARGTWLLVLMMLTCSLLITVALGAGEYILPDSGGLFLIAQFTVTLASAMMFGQTGFIDFLRRVDLLKPLPFSATVIVVMETLAKSVTTILNLFISCAIMFALQPDSWAYSISALLGLPTVALVAGATALLATLLFPDIDDPSQRGLRGLLQLVATLVVLVPSGLVFAGAWILRLPPILGSLPAAAINLAIVFVIASVSGRLYAGYNPSE